MESAVKAPLSERINFRIIVFALAVLAPVGWIVYTYVDAVVSGGIHDRGGYIEADLKAMSLFPFDQVNGKLTDVPPQWRALDGKRVQVVGEMWAPGSAAPEIRNFQVVYSIGKCCFNGPPQIQHFVQAEAKGGTVPFISGLVKITGTLHVDVKRNDEKVSQVYALDVEKVEPL